MKPTWLVAFVFATIQIPVKSFVLVDEVQSAFLKIKERCIEEVKVAKEIVDKLDEAGPYPSMEDLKCYTVCLYKSFGLLDPAGNFIRERFGNLFPLELHGKQETVNQICQKPNKDLCKATYNTHICYLHYTFHPQEIEDI